MFPKRVWIAFIIVIITYGFVLQENEGMMYIHNIPYRIKHIINFSFFLFFFLIGYWGWAEYKEKWIKTIWIVSHGIILTLLILVGIFDMFSKIENLGVRYGFGNIRLFFTSPLPFGICMLLVSIKHRFQQKK